MKFRPGHVVRPPEAKRRFDGEVAYKTAERTVKPVNDLLKKLARWGEDGARMALDIRVAIAHLDLKKTRELEEKSRRMYRQGLMRLLGSGLGRVQVLVLLMLDQGTPRKPEEIAAALAREFVEESKPPSVKTVQMEFYRLAAEGLAENRYGPPQRGGRPKLWTLTRNGAILKRQLSPFGI